MPKYCLDALDLSDEQAELVFGKKISDDDPTEEKIISVIFEVTAKDLSVTEGFFDLENSDITSDFNVEDISFLYCESAYWDPDIATDIHIYTGDNFKKDRSFLFKSLCEAKKICREQNIKNVFVAKIRDNGEIEIKKILFNTDKIKIKKTKMT